MSNDKTLVTVKHGGCVQLPSSERARFEAWAEDSYHLQRMGDVYRSAITTDAWRAWQAALSAQPSPVGQTDAWATKLARESAFAHSNEHAYLPQTREETNSWQPHEWVVAAIQAAALGAPQPVGEPVTVEAVATVRRLGNGDRYIDWLTEGGIADLEAGDVLMVADRAITDEDGSGEVYAAPPRDAK